MKNVIMLASLLSLVSCASAPMSAEEKAVRVLRSSDAGKECIEIGRVMSSYGTISQQGLEDDVKRATFKLGGDTVQAMPLNSDHTLHGVAYRCKP